MTTLRRGATFLAVALALVLGMSALSTAAQAYPAGTKAHITLSASRVDHGSTITITGMNFRPMGHVTITIVCRGASSTKRYVATYGTKASGGAFGQTITVDPPFPNGRCIVTASTGKTALNSDRATFFVNTPSHSGQAATAARLASFTSGTSTSAGSGSELGVLLVGGLGIVFLFGGGVLLFASRRKYAVISG